jgi:predicted Zn-dependent peptidase
MFKKILFVFSLLLLFHPALANPDPLQIPVVPYTLKNGMKFLIVKRPGAPVFTAYIRVKVGGGDEQPGKSGIAHMLEHMAFKGTPKIGTLDYAKEKKILDQIETVGVRLSELTRSGQDASPEAKKLRDQLKQLQKETEPLLVKDEFSRAFTKNGANNFNASTWKDMTSYYEELPSNKLELWAYLDSERLKNPVFREFYQERDVVLEERRTRVDNSPFGKNLEALHAAAFEKSPYKDPTIGYEKEVAALTATDLQNFYKIYYVPQNMVGAVVGDIDIERTKTILDRYFGTIPAGPTPPPVNFVEPPQVKERRVSVKFDARDEIMMGYHKPTLPNREDYVFDLIGEIFCEGRTSRLHQALVEKKKIAENVDCDSSSPGSRFDNLFFVYASALGNHTLSELEKAIDEEVEKLKNTPVTQEELERARNQITSERLFKMNSNLGLAEDLTYFEVIAGDWKYLLQHEEVLKTITPQEIQAVARKFLVNTNRTVSILSKNAPGGSS